MFRATTRLCIHLRHRPLLLRRSYSFSSLRKEFHELKQFKPMERFIIGIGTGICFTGCAAIAFSFYKDELIDTALYNTLDRFFLYSIPIGLATGVFFAIPKTSMFFLSAYTIRKYYEHQCSLNARANETSEINWPD